MDKEKLKRYRKLLSEIALLKGQLEKIEPDYVKDSVSGSSSYFPYTKHKVHIEGYDLNSYERKVARLNRRIVKKMNELVAEKEGLIEFIYNIEDSVIRQIFIYRYLEGFTWKDIGDRMHFGTSTIRMKHDNFIKTLAPISTFKDI